MNVMTKFRIRIKSGSVNLPSLFYMKEKMSQFVLVLWLNDTPVTGNVINLKLIKSPRKPVEEHQVGKPVFTKCPGFPGKFPGILGKIAGMYNVIFLSIVFHLCGPDQNPVTHLYLFSIRANM